MITRDLLAIERHLQRIEGQQIRSCLDLVIDAYWLEPTPEDLELGRIAKFPHCIMRPGKEASDAMLEFLGRHLRQVCGQPQPGDCLAMSIKTGREYPDHLGVLTSYGLYHYELRGKVVVVGPSVKLSQMQARTMAVFRP